MIEKLIEFGLFGIIEIVILLMFYKYVGKFTKIKWWHLFILIPFHFGLGLIEFPFVKQIGMIIIDILYLLILKENKWIKCAKYVVLGFIYLVCIEMIICVILDIFISFNFTTLDVFTKFLVMIPIRFIELLLIIIYKRKRYKVGLDLDVAN